MQHITKDRIEASPIITVLRRLYIRVNGEPKNPMHNKKWIKIRILLFIFLFVHFLFFGIENTD